MIKIVRLRDETDTSTLFEFLAPDKILRRGSLAPTFKVNVTRNKRIANKDILHKKGISNREFLFRVVLTGANRFTNLTTLTALAEAETTVYLDTEGLYDTYNGTYLFNGIFDHDIDEKDSHIRVTFRLIEVAN